MSKEDKETVVGIIGPLLDGLLMRWDPEGLQAAIQSNVDGAAWLRETVEGQQLAQEIRNFIQSMSYLALTQNIDIDNVIQGCKRSSNIKWYLHNHFCHKHYPWYVRIIYHAPNQPSGVDWVIKMVKGSLDAIWE